MDKSLFRKKSIDKIKSPDNLNEYIKISNPSLWILLAAIIILAAGALVWGIFGQIKSKATITVEVNKGIIYSQIDDETIAKIKPDMEFEMSGTKGYIKKIELKDDYYNIYNIETDIVMPDGSYDIAIIVDKIKPISFLLN